MLREHGHCIHNELPDLCNDCRSAVRQAAKHFRRAAAEYAKCMVALRAAYPDAQLYFDENCPYLLAGDSHDDFRGQLRHRQDRILVAFSPWPHMGAGGW